ncbi:MAG: glutathione S-transferase family protein [Sphingobium sp.]|uniref:glutathione S-transferase family protein n=1 Tax=Sphingobium sp. TaxID=1912891 RepID=UPI0029ADFFFE|nr:glutathione S-transferase family protein [Sphingobium sp.]MDX3908705.1 glutathione S-transferase family protein [Sphingobium sp.]
MQLYGVRGWGSGIAEAMLCLGEQSYDFIDVEGFDQPGAARDRLAAVNPLIQVPALVLADGTVMTETAAIALWLIDLGAPLAPPPNSSDRALFYRLLVWLVANVYPTFTYGDYPERWAPSAPNELVNATDRHRESLYRWLEDQVREPFVLGGSVSALDIYVTAMTSWRPREAWFRENTPKLARTADRTRALPVLAEVMRLNGWDGATVGAP